MTAKSAGEVALKVWAVVLLVSALISSFGVLFELGTRSLPWIDGDAWKISIVWNSFHSVLTIIAALLLLKYASRIAGAFKLEDREDAHLDAESFQTVALGTLGAYFLVLGIRQCAALVFELATKPAYEQENLAYLWRNQPRDLAGAIAQTLAGLILILGRRGLSAMWSRLRGHTD